MTLHPRHRAMMYVLKHMLISGHGALSLYLKNPDKYKSGSAFAPICQPTTAPWGIGAFKTYIEARTRSSPPSEWVQWDSSYLLQGSLAPKGSLHMLVDVGEADDFGKKGQLQPEKLKEAAEHAGREAGEVEVRMQEGFDHSYYFVSLGYWYRVGGQGRGLTIGLDVCAGACGVPRQVFESLVESCMLSSASDADLDCKWTLDAGCNGYFDRAFVARDK